VADDPDVLLPLGQHPGSEHGMRVTVDDGLDRLVADRADRLQQEFAVVLGVAGIEGDQALVGINDGNGRQAVAAEHPDSFDGSLDGGLEPSHLVNIVQDAFVADRAVRRSSQLGRSTHVGRRGYIRFLSLEAGGADSQSDDHRDGQSP